MLLRKDTVDRSTDKKIIDIQKQNISGILGIRGCIPEGEFVYTPKGIIDVKDVYDGLEILGGVVKEPHSFEAEVFEVLISNKIKFIASGEHPLRISKYRAKDGLRDSKWATVEQIYNHYEEKKSDDTRWHVSRYFDNNFKFDEISVSKKLARLLGYLSSDGYYRELQSIKFTNKNQDFLDDVEGLTSCLSDEYGISIKKREKGDSFDYYLTGDSGSNVSILKNKFRELEIINRNTFGKIQQFSKDCLHEFIIGYFNGNGTLYVRPDGAGTEVSFYVGIHKNQAFELQFILWRLGILSYIDYRKRDFYGDRKIENPKGCWEVAVGEKNSLEKIFNILEHTKYPDKFEKAIEVNNNLLMTSQHYKTEKEEWLPITEIKKIGVKKVIGWKTEPSREIISYVGLRTHNSGKSYLGEATLENYYEYGFTCLDLWSAPNMENAFWIFAKEGHKKRIPITILAPESFILPEARIDAFNGKFPFTRESLVKFVKLPSPTKRSDSDVNEKILEILVQVVQDCREHRRIMVFNPYMFPNETEMFRTLEILMRNLITIANNHFTALKPEDVGKKSKDEMTIREKTYHRIAFLMREFGEVAPARLKGDKSGESTIIKKALLKFVRLARHANIDGIIDYQNSTDVDASIRNQIDVWLVKTWTRELGGENFQWIFNHVSEKRNKIFEEEGYNDDSFQWADSLYPPIEKLAKGWFYVARSGDIPKLRRVPDLGVKHKEPDDKWWFMTNIPIEFDLEQITSNRNQDGTIVSRSDEKLLLLTIEQIKNEKSRKPKRWREIKEILVEKQKSGEIRWHLQISDMKTDSIARFYKRITEKENPSENGQ